MVSEKEGAVSIYLAKITTNIKLAIYFLAIFFIWNTAVSSAAAASLYISPSNGQRQVGSTFTVSVFVSSADQAMNAASGILKISNSTLEVVSISKAGSIFSLWAQEPTFTASSVSFEGIVLNPGYKGSSGKLVSVTLKAKAIGEGTISFSSGSVLANDGSGTNILTGLGSAKYALNVQSLAPPAGESTSPLERPGVPLAPKITSVTNPDPAKWYANSNPAFRWMMSSDITGVSIYGDHDSNTNPGSVSDGLFSSKTYENVEDGVWYFHLRLRNRYGWSAVSHFKFQIDTLKPDTFDVTEVTRADPSDPVATFSLKASDAHSGIDHFDVQIDQEKSQTITAEVYKTPLLLPGKHVLVAKAFDKAGNFLTNSIEFTIQAIDPPALTVSPSEPISGDILKLKGKTYPNSSVTIWLQFDSSEPTSILVGSDSAGNFETAFEDKLREGVYKLWTEVVKENGARSEPSEKVSFAVSQRAIIKFGSILVSYLSVVVSLMSLIFTLIAVIWYFGFRLRKLKSKLRRDIDLTSKTLHEQFDALRYGILVQIEILEKVKTKRDLTKEEDKIISQLRKHLDSAEVIIHKEFKHLEKDLE